MGPHEVLKAIDNLADEPLKLLLKAAFTPVGTGPVATNPHFVFIISNIIRGMTAIEVAELTEREKKAFVTPEAIYEYMLQHVSPRIIQPSLADKWLGQMEEVDEIATLKLILKIQKQKVLARIQKPTSGFEDEESRRRDIDSLRKTCVDLNKMKKDVAVAESEAPVMVTTIGSTQQQVTEKLDQRAAASALDALKSLGVVN